MTKWIFLFGLLPDAVRAIKEVVDAVRAGDELRAMRAAARAAEVQAFRAYQIKLRGG